MKGTCALNQLPLGGAFGMVVREKPSYTKKAQKRGAGGDGNWVAEVS